MILQSGLKKRGEPLETVSRVNLATLNKSVRRSDDFAQKQY